MDNKKAFMLIFKSTLAVSVVALCIGISASIMGANFWAVFVLSVAVQYILFGFIGTLVGNFLSNKTKLKELEKLEQLSTILECSFCKSKNIITFIPDENERVEFKCESCGKPNVVNIHFTVARITDPAPALPTLKEISPEE